MAYLHVCQQKSVYHQYELYHLEKDPHEFKNLASDENYTEIKNKLKISIPKSAAKIRKIPKNSPFHRTRN